MIKNLSSKTATKALHPSNVHNNGYDFVALINTLPVLGDYVSTNKYGTETIDFANPLAVKALNTALLKHHYEIAGWDIPAGYLCPPIPGRVDYIHYIADLLEATNIGDTAKNSAVKLLDIGTGANGIYAILAAQVFGWQCVATDIDTKALDNVKQVVSHNPSLVDRVEVRLQSNKKQLFKGIIQSGEMFDVSVCNPPFYASLKEALGTNKQKRDNLAKSKQKAGHKQSNKKTRLDTKALNFGGLQTELWYEGGEQAFLRTMMQESKDFAQQCRWFTSLVSKAEYLAPAKKLLKQLGVTKVKEIEMTQGNKITRVLAWSFV